MGFSIEVRSLHKHWRLCYFLVCFLIPDRQSRYNTLTSNTEHNEVVLQTRAKKHRVPSSTIARTASLDSGQET